MGYLKASGPQNGMDKCVRLFGALDEYRTTLRREPLAVNDIRFPLGAFATERERDRGL
jgi:hypothetical protein